MHSFTLEGSEGGISTSPGEGGGTSVGVPSGGDNRSGTALSIGNGRDPLGEEE